MHYDQVPSKAGSKKHRHNLPDNQETYKIDDFEKLKEFLKSKTGLRMSHVYKPIMLLEVLRRGGSASREQIAEAFVLRDTSQIDFYRRKIVHPMPGQRLVRDGLIKRDGEQYRLAGPLAALSGNRACAKIQMIGCFGSTAATQGA
jgi:hypothetical protein